MLGIKTAKAAKPKQYKGDTRGNTNAIVDTALGHAGGIPTQHILANAFCIDDQYDQYDLSMITPVLLERRSSYI